MCIKVQIFPVSGGTTRASSATLPSQDNGVLMQIIDLVEAEFRHTRCATAKPKITRRMEDEERFVCCVRVALELAYRRTGSGLGQARCTARDGGQVLRHRHCQSDSAVLVSPFHLGAEVVSLAGMLTRNGDT